jgi:His-Xaa-Ser system protein HxsD
MADGNGRQDESVEHDQQDTVALDRLAPAWIAGPRCAALSISRAVYSRRSVLAAAYKFSDRCAILVDEDGGDRWAVYLIAPPEGDVKRHLTLFVSELVDQALRDTLELEFGDLRTLIVAQAFSEGNLLDPTRDTADDSRDPNGIEQRR